MTQFNFLSFFVAVLLAGQVANTLPTTGEHPTQTLPAGTPQVFGLATNWTTPVNSSLGVNRVARPNDGLAVSAVDVETLKYYGRLASVSRCSFSTGKFECSTFCSKYPGTTLIKFFNTPNTNTTGYIARNDANKAVYVAFRGSTNINNWVHDAEFLFTKYSPARGAKVHSGFYKTWQDARNIVYPIVVKEMGRNPDYKLYMLGHSLGGALTVLQALDFYQNAGYDSSKMAVYTFGQPRIGNPAFSDYVDSLDLPIYRTINQNDVVPHMGPEAIGYKHHGTEYWIENSQGDVGECWWQCVFVS
ncbi:Alpha/Beta hydrolase protein [Jimgerdemannia flammicorona]|uniref:Alpha/Beta hydrolase protein n=1 Tax=Jimgerdemannia flammicorona TaxID=994334 RepID=A0A433QNI2_9FUNG|nr:Alpha/Beta hydrolase protein [Jimgerdemannia flammicorona]